MSMVVVVYIINEHATATINMKGCTLMVDVEEHEQKRKKKKRKKEKKRGKKKVSTEGFEPVIFCLESQLC